MMDERGRWPGGPRGWYLLRCRACGKAFIDTNPEWCDCGNSRFNTYPKGIDIEMDLEMAEGTIVVWDEKRHWKDRIREWLGRNRTANFLTVVIRRIWAYRTSVDFSKI